MLILMDLYICTLSARVHLDKSTGEKHITSSSSIPSRAVFYCVQHCRSVDHLPTKQFKFTTTGLEYLTLLCTDVEVNQTIKHILNMNLSQIPRLSLFLYLCESGQRPVKPQHIFPFFSLHTHFQIL